MLRLAECMQKMDIDQKQLALTIGVKPPSVSRWVNGQKQPTIEHLVDLANVFGVSVDYLVGNSETPQPGLNGIESKLLQDFRMLNKQGQEYILQTIYTACTSGIYKKPGNISGLESVTR